MTLTILVKHKCTYAFMKYDRNNIVDGDVNDDVNKQLHCSDNLLKEICRLVEALYRNSRAQQW